MSWVKESEEREMKNEKNEMKKSSGKRRSAGEGEKRGVKEREESAAARIHEEDDKKVGECGRWRRRGEIDLQTRSDLKQDHVALFCSNLESNLKTRLNINLPHPPT